MNVARGSVARPGHKFALVQMSTYRKMADQQSNNPLHGVTLESVLTQLVARYGWEELGRHVDIRCFKNDPSIKSSLAFLRKTPWARKKVEDLFIAMKTLV
jgi:uncharacterized protein (DUF2132 family)